MPDVAKALRDLATTNISGWTETVIAEFTENRCNEGRVVAALKSYQPLKKSGNPFPTSDTTVKEIEAALEAMNKRNYKVYTQHQRPIFLFGEPQFGIARIHELIRPSVALGYEAAAFEAFATVKHQITAAYSTVLTKYPGDRTQVNAAKLETIVLIKKELAREIANTEYEEALLDIIGNPAIPEEEKEPSVERKRRNHGREVDLASLISEIEWLKKEYNRIETHLEHLIQRYRALKKTLEGFIPTMPESLKREAQTILTDLGKAEERQTETPFLLANTGSTLISTFLAKAQTQIRTTMAKCEKIERFLNETSDDPFIRPACKKQFNTNLAAFNDKKDSLPVDQRLAQAEILKREGEEAYTFEEKELSSELVDYFYRSEALTAFQRFREARSAQKDSLQEQRLLHKEIIAIKAYNRMNTLLARIEDLRQHADSMSRGSKKRVAIEALVKNLKEQIKTYLGQIRTAENPLTDVKHQDFENQFKTTLLNKDTMKVMRQYRTPGRLIANILLACTVFGGILMLIRAAMMAAHQRQQKEKPSLTLNQVGFFAKTRSEQDIEAINDALLTARPVETGLR